MTTATPFAQLNLPAAVLNNLESLNYLTMTPIQAASLPLILDAQDLIAQARTGSGKTASFGLGILGRLNLEWFSIQALVLCPTRELAEQVGKEIRRLARTLPNIKLVNLCGGSPIGPQIASLEYGAHIVVGTPGRVLKHLQQGSLHLDNLAVLVLDEADRMLDMGFEPAMHEIRQYLPSDRQTLLFSATYPDNMAALVRKFLTNPQEVKIADPAESAQIEQRFYEVSSKLKLETLSRLLSQLQLESTLVFCNTRIDCEQINQALQQQGFASVALHGDLDQKERDQCLLRFANRSQSVLVATDVAARGLDIQGLDAVINYELPSSPEVQVHRIGRTGRAGQSGIAISLFSPAEAYRVNEIEEYQGYRVKLESISSLTSEIRPFKPAMSCLAIDGGRKAKLRPGDLLGALTGDCGLAAAEVGKIDIGDHQSFVAIKRERAQHGLTSLQQHSIKGKKFRVRLL